MAQNPGKLLRGLNTRLSPTLLWPWPKSRFANVPLIGIPWYLILPAHPFLEALMRFAESCKDARYCARLCC